MVVCEVGRRMALRVFVAPARDEAKRHQRVVLGRSELGGALVCLVVVVEGGRYE